MSGGDRGRETVAVLEDLLQRIGDHQKAGIGDMADTVRTEEGEKWLTFIFDLVEALRTLPLGLLPLVHLEEVTKFFSQVEGDLKDLRAFDPAGLADPQGEWDGLVKRIRDDFSRNYENISPYLGVGKRD